MFTSRPPKTDDGEGYEGGLEYGGEAVMCDLNGKPQKPLFFIGEEDEVFWGKEGGNVSSLTHKFNKSDKTASHLPPYAKL